MRKICCLFMMFFCVCLANALEIVHHGKAKAALIVEAGASPGIQFAAQDLAAYLKKISGADVPILTSAEGPRIVLALENSTLLPESIKARLGATKEKAAYYLKSEGDAIYIAAKEVYGVIHGAAVFLEECLGVRWFLPGEDFEYVPKQSDLNIHELDLFREPAFNYRRRLADGTPGAYPDSLRWSLRHGLTSSFNTSSLVKKHTPEDLFLYELAPAESIEAVGRHGCFLQAAPVEKYLESKPELFALVGGKRAVGKKPHHCLSNPELHQIVADYICDYVQKRNYQVSWLIGCWDSASEWCECSRCQALDGNEKDLNIRQSRRFFTAAKAISDRVLRQDPKVDICCWAYQKYRTPLPEIQLDPRVRINFCVHGRCHAHALDDPSCPGNVAILKLLKQWSARGHSMEITEYGGLLYAPVEKHFANDLKTYRQYGADGYMIYFRWPDRKFAHPNFQRDDEWTLMPKNWLLWYLASKLFWDPDLDVSQIISDVYPKYYGKAWPAMQKYHALRQQLWDAGRGCAGYPTADNRSPKLLSNPDRKEKLLQFLDEAEHLAKPDASLSRRIAMDRRFLTEEWILPNEQIRRKEGKSLQAPLPISPIRIDGSLDEEAWNNASFCSDFCSRTAEKQQLPNVLKTSLGILSDSENLYLSISAKDPAMSALKAEARGIVKNWADFADDALLQIMLVPVNVTNHYYQIVCNANAALFQLRQPGSTPYSLEIEAAAKRHDDAFCIELRIPFKNMDGDFMPGSSLGIHVGRHCTPAGMTEGVWTIDGEQMHSTTQFRKVILGNPVLLNGNFQRLDDANPSIPWGWRFDQNCKRLETGPNQVQVLIGKHGQLAQNIPHSSLPISKTPQKILIRVLASGPADLEVSANCYVYSAPNMRELVRRDIIASVALHGQMALWEAEYTVRPEEFLRLQFKSLNGETRIENAAVTILE